MDVASLLPPPSAFLSVSVRAVHRSVSGEVRQRALQVFRLLGFLDSASARAGLRGACAPAPAALCSLAILPLPVFASSASTRRASVPLERACRRQTDARPTAVATHQVFLFASL